MQIKKSSGCLILILLISIFGITTINALNIEEWHTANKISFAPWVSVTLGYKSISTLEDIVSLKLDATKFQEGDSSFAVAGGHKASEIWVLTKNGEMTLLQAINSGEKGLCPRADISTELIYSGPIDKTQAYHYATEVEVTTNEVITSLQNAIDGGYFCANYSWVISDWTGGPGCGVVTQTRTYYCARSDGLVMDDSYCTGERECDPSSWICITSTPSTTQTYFHQCYWTFDWTDYRDGLCDFFVKDISYFWNGPIACSYYGSWDQGQSMQGTFLGPCRIDYYRCY